MFFAATGAALVAVALPEERREPDSRGEWVAPLGSALRPAWWPEHERVGLPAAAYENGLTPAEQLRADRCRCACARPSSVTL